MKIPSLALARYGVATVVSFATNIGLTALLHEVLLVREELAFAVAIVVVFLLNFAMLRYFVYPASRGSVSGQFVGMLFSSLGFRGAEYLTFLLLHTWLGFHYVAVIVLTLSGSSIAKFFYYGKFVFGSTRGQPRSSSGSDRYAMRN